ncbi:quaternary ammonium compound-resistance protein SugE [Halopenitus persicus]|uniref:Quaternary ammonium compound-resistance protein SugE n=1 Tax=Halopenitus persicus TaxID=1048396 RepID=A0A1H3EGM9_9EURY|nr:SMR family transporter [Halopenitus persicus]SDX77851.1 quaternary ammonium compound-resistance protein SugE [Halopenitus persicus]
MPTAGAVVALVISIVLLAQAVKDLPAGAAYAVRTGIGASTATLGIRLFDEPAALVRTSFISVIVVGIRFARRLERVATGQPGRPTAHRRTGDRI